MNTISCGDHIEASYGATDMSSEMIVDVCADLRPGDRIEARHHGRRQQRGTVTETIPGMGLVWILEETLSERKLLDTSDVQIDRIHGSRRKDISAHRIFATTIDAPGLSGGNNVVAALTEIDRNGNPFLGSAAMKVYNVVPLNNRVDVRGEVEWDTDLAIRVTIMYQ